jgi:hypothetical protein
MLRLFTPIQLVACIGLFFLPWIEIQCPKLDLNGLDGKAGGGRKPDPRAESYTPFISQSGFQVATGDYTIQDGFTRMMMEQGDKSGAPPKKEDEIPQAPLLFGFLVAVSFGAVLGFALTPGWARKIVLILCCIGALGVIGGQFAMGFPIEKAVREGKKKDAARGGGGDFDRKSDVAPEEIFKTVYKWPFYLSLALVLGAAFTALIEPGPPSPKRKRDRDRDAEEDSDRDEEPRRRHREKPREKSREEPLEVPDWGNDPDLQQPDPPPPPHAP